MNHSNRRANAGAFASLAESRVSTAKSGLSPTMLRIRVRILVEHPHKESVGVLSRYQ
jgi:hypothetical protein